MTGPALLRRYLKEKGWTVADLCRATGLDDGGLSRIVRGTRGAGLEAAVKIEKATGGKVPATSWLADT